MKKSMSRLSHGRSESGSVWVKAAKPKGGGKSKGKGPRESLRRDRDIQPRRAIHRRKASQRRSTELRMLQQPFGPLGYGLFVTVQSLVLKHEQCISSCDEVEAPSLANSFSEVLKNSLQRLTSLDILVLTSEDPRMSQPALALHNMKAVAMVISVAATVTSAATAATVTMVATVAMAAMVATAWCASDCRSKG